MCREDHRIQPSHLQLSLSIFSPSSTMFWYDSFQRNAEACLYISLEVQLWKRREVRVRLGEAWSSRPTVGAPRDTASCVGGTPEFFSPVLLTLSKKVTMGVPGVPAMLTDKFCGCIDIDVGLRILSIVYAVFWVSCLIFVSRHPIAVYAFCLKLCCKCFWMQQN